MHWLAENFTKLKVTFYKCLHLQILTKVLDSLEQKFVDLSKELLHNAVLLTSTLPSDLIRTQVELISQQNNLKSRSTQLNNLAEERNNKSVQIRRYREFLAMLEDWLIQTQNSVAAELKFFANKISCGEVQILEVSYLR